MPCHRSALLPSLALVLSATTAFAGDWEGRLATYYWQTGFDLGATVDDTPDEVYSGPFSEIAWSALLVQGETRKDRHTVFGEFNWLDIDDTTEPAFGFLDVDMRISGHMYALGYGYAFHDTQDTRLELMGGFRHWTANFDIDFGRFGEHRFSETITDPFVGLRGEAYLSERWRLNGELGYGGFDIGSERQIDAQMRATYQISDMLSATLGYRYLEVDFQEDSNIDKLAIFGPTIGIEMQF